MPPRLGVAQGMRLGFVFEDSGMVVALSFVFSMSSVVGRPPAGELLLCPRAEPLAPTARSSDRGPHCSQQVLEHEDSEDRLQPVVGASSV
jgi:hypothetical protein